MARITFPGSGGGYGGTATGRPRPNPFGSQPGSNNTGYPGTTTQTPVDTTPTTPTPPETPAPAPRTRVTSLMEGDPGKLADPNHIANSPKYQFLSLAPYYGRGQENDLLKQLQSQYGQYWNGWNFDGKGNFVYGGDPRQLNAAWDGVTFVDAYGGYGGGGPLQARWGANENMQPAAQPLVPPTGQPTTPQMPYYFDPSMLQYPSGYGGGAPAAPVQQTPSILNNPQFWQSLMSMFAPQPGYSNQSAPTFSGAQGGGYGHAQTNPNQAQFSQMLSQLLAGLSGGA